MTNTNSRSPTTRPYAFSTVQTPLNMYGVASQVMSQTQGSKPKGGQNKLPPLDSARLKEMSDKRTDDVEVVRADASNCSYAEFHGRLVTWHMLYRLAIGKRGSFTQAMGRQLQDLNVKEEGTRMTLNDRNHPKSARRNQLQERE